MRCKLELDTAVHIHLTNGSSVRGVVSSVNSDIVVIEGSAEIHTIAGGVIKFERVWVNPDTISAVGFK